MLLDALNKLRVLSALLEPDYLMFRWFKSRRYHALTKRALVSCDDALLRAVLKSTPLLQTPWSDLEFLVIDLETTGLDPLTSHIVSIGSVVIRDQRVQLSSADHTVIRTHSSVGSSAEIHGLRDQDIEQGEDLEGALRTLLESIEKKVIVFHYAELDQRMLDKAFEKYFGAPLAIPIIDTLQLAKRVFAHEEMPAEGFRLGALRRRVGLPNVRQHNALTDAMATAELLLVLLKRLDHSGRKPVIDYLQ